MDRLLGAQTIAAIVISNARRTAPGTMMSQTVSGVICRRKNLCDQTSPQAITKIRQMSRRRWWSSARISPASCGSGPTSRGSGSAWPGRLGRVLRKSWVVPSGREGVGAWGAGTAPPPGPERGPGPAGGCRSSRRRKSPPDWPQGTGPRPRQPSGLRVNCSSACWQPAHVSTWASTSAASAPASPSASHLPSSADEGQGVKVKAPDRPQGARRFPLISQPAREKPDTSRPLFSGARSRLVQPGDLLVQHLLHLALGLVDRGHLQAQPRRRLRPGQPVQGRQPERLPGVRLDALLDPGLRLGQHLLVELLVEPPHQVIARLDRLQQPQHIAAADAGPGLSAGLQEVTPGVAGQGPDVGAEAPGRVVGEGAHPGAEPDEHGLGDVLGVSLLEPPAAAPAVNLRPVAADELGPGFLVRGLLAQPPQQAGTGRWGRVVGHPLHLWSGSGPPGW